MLGRSWDEDRGEEGKRPGAIAPENFFVDTSFKALEMVVKCHFFICYNSLQADFKMSVNGLGNWCELPNPTPLHGSL